MRPPAPTSTACRTTAPAAAYEPDVKLGPKACPFNYLYWDFLIRNEAKLKANPRMAMPYRTLAKMDEAKKTEITAEATAFLDNL